MRGLLTTLLAFIAGLFHVPASAMALDCRMRSFDDGRELLRLHVSVAGDFVSVLERRPATPRHRATENLREIQFHHYSNPVEIVRGKERRLEQPHSVLVLKKFRHASEVAPDILVVDWGKGTLKSSSAYGQEFTINWHCTRMD